MLSIIWAPAGSKTDHVSTKPRVIWGDTQSAPLPYLFPCLNELLSGVLAWPRCRGGTIGYAPFLRWPGNCTIFQQLTLEPVEHRLSLTMQLPRSRDHDCS